jgi:hypothetical protein
MNNCLSGPWSFIRNERWASAVKDIGGLRDLLQAQEVGAARLVVPY